MATKRFTYSSDPSSSSKDEVRFLIGDTDSTRPIFDDREIAYQVAKTPNTRMAGAELLEIKSRDFAAKADVRVGDVSKSFSKAAASMLEAARTLRRDALNRAKPFFGGLSKSGKIALSEDTDAVQPQFSIGMSDDPSAVQLNDDLSALTGLVGISGL